MTRRSLPYILNSTADKTAPHLTTTQTRHWTRRGAKTGCKGRAGWVLDLETRKIVWISEGFTPSPAEELIMGQYQ